MNPEAHHWGVSALLRPGTHGSGGGIVQTPQQIQDGWTGARQKLECDAYRRDNIHIESCAVLGWFCMRRMPKEIEIEGNPEILVKFRRARTAHGTRTLT